MSVADMRVDLTNCDREPIHKLGKIQPFGALIAVNNDWFISQRSTNLEAILGIEKRVELGARLGSVLSSEAVSMLRNGVAALFGRNETERMFGIDLLGDGRLFDCALHYSGQYSVIEIERHEDGDVTRQMSILKPIVNRLGSHKDVVSLTEDAARQLRMTLGIDRVMVYKFHGDLSGEVLAEARNDDLEAFHGLRYPKTDIPAQARELYVRNRFRIVSDVNAEPIAIEPGVTIEGEEMDLSLSVLRAVSPIHIEYLRNMGVAASLSISIVINGKLWGLFACHHYSPKTLPFSQRTAAELFSELFSLVLGRVLADEQQALRDTGREVHDRLMRDIAAGTPLIDSLPTLDPVIQSVIPHDGASIFIEDVYQTRGRTPNEEEFRALLPSLNSAATSRVLAVDALAERMPRAHAFEDRAVGALVVPVSRMPRDYLILWRKPLTQVVTWGGNPEKPVEIGPNGVRLTPRKSFEAWQQSVEGRSAPWTEGEVNIAEQLRVTLLEIILRLTDEAVQERAKAQQQQELLIAELNHRVRNILNLIRGLINQSRGEADSIENFAEIVGGRISSLASAHDNITKGNWSSASLHDLIDTEADAYSSGNRDRVSIEGPEAMVSPEAYTVLALVIHEMITNSAKYGSLADSSGNLVITVARDKDDALLIEWVERGGPPVKPPKRRGFGSTIIERSIPFELSGDANIEYKLSGVEAQFCVPARYVTWAKTKTRSGDRRKPSEKTLSANQNVPESVLLVEDSMIIALDTEDSLRELGVKAVQVQSSVAAALAALEKSTPAFAILDYNLGKENSERVAEVLQERNVPFWLATGYGEMADRLERLGARGLLTKPYGKEELAKVIDELN